MPVSYTHLDVYKRQALNCGWERDITTKERGMQNTLENQNQIIKTEVLAGCTTFVASVYIILTNALILADAGISQDAVSYTHLYLFMLILLVIVVLEVWKFGSIIIMISILMSFVVVCVMKFLVFLILEIGG